MNRSAIILTAALMVSGCASLGGTAPTVPAAMASAEAGDPALASIIADYEAWLKRESGGGDPESGDDDGSSRMPDLSREKELTLVEPLTGFKRRLDAVSTAGLSDQDAENHAFLSRPPTPEESAKATAAMDGGLGLPDLAWVLLNSREFLFIP